MPKKKKQIKLHMDNKQIEVDGVMFRAARGRFKKIDGVEHTDYLIFEEVDSKALEKKTEFIKKKLSEQVTTSRILDEVIKDMSVQKINRVHKLLKQHKAKVKPQDGCLGFKVTAGKGKSAYIPVFD